MSLADIMSYATGAQSRREIESDALVKENSLLLTRSRDLLRRRGRQEVGFRYGQVLGTLFPEKNPPARLFFEKLVTLPLHDGRNGLATITLSSNFEDVAEDGNVTLLNNGKITIKVKPEQIPGVKSRKLQFTVGKTEEGYYGYIRTGSPSSAVDLDLGDYKALNAVLDLLI